MIICWRDLEKKLEILPAWTFFFSVKDLTIWKGTQKYITWVISAFQFYLKNFLEYWIRNFAIKNTTQFFEHLKIGSPMSLAFKIYLKYLIATVNHGRSQDFSKRRGHTKSYKGYSPDCDLNIVGCLLTKGLQRGFTGTPSAYFKFSKSRGGGGRLLDMLINFYSETQ